MSGASPIAGTQVSLYEATNNAPKALGSTTSSPNGHFTINYNTSDSGQYIYLVAQGLATSTPSNTNINLVNVVGTIGSVPATASANINELTTVGSYQAFANDWNSASSVPALIQTGTNTNGMAISLSTYKSLIDPATGNLNNQLNATTAEQIEAQGNVLALCVQNANECSTLAGSTYLDTANTDTFSLIAGLKQASSTSLTNVNNLLQNSTNLPYINTNLTQTGLGITYNTQFSSPNGITSDNTGNIWVTNYNNSVTELKNTGGAYSTVVFSGSSYQFSNPYAITSDSNGNIWVTNYNTSSVIEMKNTAGAYSPAPLSGNYQFGQSAGITSDTNDNIWVTNYSGSSVSEIKNTNGAYSPVIFSDSSYQFSSPRGITSDSNGNIWVANFGSFGQPGGNSVTEIKNTSGTYSPVVFSDSSYQFSSPIGLTADGNGNIWVINFGGNSVTELKNTNGTYSPVVFSDSSYQFSSPRGITSDSNGNIWVANFGGNSVTEIKNTNGTYSPVVFSDSSYGFSAPIAITADKSGNIWVANNSGNSVTEIIN